jgi:hypothetical protein
MNLRYQLANGRRWLLALLVAAAVIASAFGAQAWPAQAGELSSAPQIACGPGPCGDPGGGGG